jgi:hypothetical protein
MKIQILTKVNSVEHHLFFLTLIQNSKNSSINLERVPSNVLITTLKLNFENDRKLKMSFATITNE